MHKTMLWNLKHTLGEINGKRIFKSIFIDSERGFKMSNFILLIIYSFGISKMTPEALCSRKE